MSIANILKAIPGKSQRGFMRTVDVGSPPCLDSALALLIHFRVLRNHLSVGSVQSPEGEMEHATRRTPTIELKV
jgi:hypothetical protein